MSMNDTISDMLTRIRNSCLRKHKTVSYLKTKANLNISKILLDEGFIAGYATNDNSIEAELKYYPHNNDPVIRKIQRISKPGLRVYKNHKKLNPVMNGQGIYIISTSKGVVSDSFCRASNVGGEVLCMVY